MRLKEHNVLNDELLCSAAVKPLVEVLGDVVDAAITAQLLIPVTVLRVTVNPQVCLEICLDTAFPTVTEKIFKMSDQLVLLDANGEEKTTTLNAEMCFSIYFCTQDI